MTTKQRQNKYNVGKAQRTAILAKMAELKVLMDEAFVEGEGFEFITTGYDDNQRLLQVAVGLDKLVK